MIYPEQIEKAARQFNSAPIRAFLHASHSMNGAAERELADRHTERTSLICLLRDETQSKAVYSRCVALVGERS